MKTLIANFRAKLALKVMPKQMNQALTDGMLATRVLDSQMPEWKYREWLTKPERHVKGFAVIPRGDGQ